MKHTEILNRLAEFRQQRGYSASELARLSGASRATIYAIETGTYIPNTALTLRLARALGTSVESLFELNAEPEQPHSVNVHLLDDAAPLKPGAAVQLCSVSGTTIALPVRPAPAFLPASDGVLVPHAGRPAALLFRHDPVPERLLIGGCDPALSVLSGHAAEAGVQVALASCNSTRALELLRRGRIHVAGTHLQDSAEAGTAAVRKAFPRGGVRVVTFASWQEGFVVAPGNPKKIRTASDLARPGIQIVNRDSGAGSRILLDRELKKAGVPTRRVKGYGRVANGHLPAAWYVATGAADCCVATESAARAFGLGFVPIRSERFDLVIPARFESSALVQRMLDALQHAAFRNRLELLAGYDTRETGRVVM